MNKLIITASFLFVTLASFAQVSLRLKHFNVNNGVAIQGYDPVSYFVQHKAIKGKKELNVAYEGVTYYFATQSDKEVFLKNPKQYEPQYGGWCAYAMGASGEKVEIDPETFKILYNKLFLFYHTWVNNTLTKWNKDEGNLHAKADVNWNKLYKL